MGETHRKAGRDAHSLLLLRLLNDEGDQLLDQEDEDQEPDDAPHDGQDDECHRVVHFFHCEVEQEEGCGVGAAPALVPETSCFSPAAQQSASDTPG